jgi:hypothetical protein
MYIRKFLNIKVVKKILSDILLTPEQESGLLDYFDLRGYRKSQDHFMRLAWFLKQGYSDVISREFDLLKHERMSVEYFCILYGAELGLKRWNNNLSKIKDYFPSRKIYWTNQGFTEAEAIEKVRNHQIMASGSSRNKNHRKCSVRCVEYWEKKGYDKESAEVLVTTYQARGLPFYIEKYGTIEGAIKYRYACNKRKQTWKNKTQDERSAHYLKTLQKSFNINGQEMQAVNLFIEQNNINRENCMFGAPTEQYFQWIPTAGFRRYDLAVFADSAKKELLCIMEFHGPGHINFSDYKEELSNKIIEVDNKPLPHLGTYGDSYRNDNIKKNHILNTFTGTKYYVFWNNDLKNRNFKINELRKN